MSADLEMRVRAMHRVKRDCLREREVAFLALLADMEMRVRAMHRVKRD